MLQMVKKNLGPYNSGYHKWICCTYSSLYSVGFYKYNKVEQLTKFLRMSFCSHQRTDDFSCLGSFENMPPILFLVGWEGVRSFLKPFFFERRCSEVEICFVQKWEYTGCSIIRGTHVDGIFYIENWKILPRNFIRILKRFRDRGYLCCGKNLKTTHAIFSMKWIIHSSIHFFRDQNRRNRIIKMK